MPTVNREEFLGILQSVSPGLSQRETIEQSNCFIFRDGKVRTFNEEVHCSRAVPFTFTAAVPAPPLMALLSQLSEESVDVNYTEGELLLTGRRCKAGIRSDAEIALPLDHIEEPGKWRPLVDGFAETIGMCQQYVGKDATKYYLTCVHIHPDWIEASDEIQIIRFKMKTGVTEECLLNRDSVKYIMDTGARKFSETPSWFHLKNAAGLVLSCRRYLLDYPTDEITKYLKTTGRPVALPKGLKEAAARASVFSKDNADSNQVMVDLKPGKVRIKGVGVAGWYQENAKVQYQDEPLSFLISPDILMDVITSHTDVLVGDGLLRVDKGNFQYCSCLGVDEESQETEQ